MKLFKITYRLKYKIFISYNLNILIENELQPKIYKNINNIHSIHYNWKIIILLAKINQ